MTDAGMEDFYNQKGYKIRSMKSLMIQIREDHRELIRLWERFQKGPGDISEIDELVRVLSWLKEGLDVFEEMKKKDIEGLSWGELQGIKMNVRDKEIELKKILFFVSKDTENCHLR